jgi:hypothetical protein
MDYHVDEIEEFDRALTNLLSSDMARILFNLDIIPVNYFWELDTYNLFKKTDSNSYRIIKRC